MSEDVKEMRKTATRGNSERCYLKVCFGMVLRMEDGRKHLPLNPEVIGSNPVIESYVCFKPILNPLELMPKLDSFKFE